MASCIIKIRFVVSSSSSVEALPPPAITMKQLNFNGLFFYFRAEFSGNEPEFRVWSKLKLIRGCFKEQSVRVCVCVKHPYTVQLNQPITRQPSLLLAQLPLTSALMGGGAFSIYTCSPLSGRRQTGHPKPGLELFISVLSQQPFYLHV